MVQVSMDGPNVNGKFFELLKQKILSDHGTNLINIGSCGLHVIHNSFKTGLSQLGGMCPPFYLVCTIFSKIHQPEGRTSRM